MNKFTYKRWVMVLLVCAVIYTRIYITPAKQDTCDRPHRGLRNHTPVAAPSNEHYDTSGHPHIYEKDLNTAIDALYNQSDAHRVMHVMEELQESLRLQQEVRVFCWILISPIEHATLGPPLRDTWGRRCNKLVFMSTENDPSIGAVDCGSKEGYTKLWNKTRSALTYIYKNYLNDYDWFLKADTNTYVVVENLRYLLADRDTNGDKYYGLYYSAPWGKYNSGGAGYVMGREAVRRFVEQAIPNHKICKPERKKGEDFGMGKCLRAVGVLPVDVRDDMGRGRFFQYHPVTFMIEPRRHRRLEVFQSPEGFRNCCSSSVVTFHEMKTSDMYLFHYLIYTLQPHGHLNTLPIHALTMPPQ